MCVVNAAFYLVWFSKKKRDFTSLGPRKMWSSDAWPWPPRLVEVGVWSPVLGVLGIIHSTELALPPLCQAPGALSGYSAPADDPAVRYPPPRGWDCRMREWSAAPSKGVHSWAKVQCQLTKRQAFSFVFRYCLFCFLFLFLSKQERECSGQSPWKPLWHPCLTVAAPQRDLDHRHPHGGWGEWRGFLRVRGVRWGLPDVGLCKPAPSLI